MNLPTLHASAGQALASSPEAVRDEAGPRASQNGVIFVFGNCELDHARFQLRRDNARVPVQPKALRLLFYLVAQRERAVSSEELLARIWPCETVTRASLKRAVLAARRAIDEGGEEQSSIRTVRGYGYHFVRPVQVIVLQRAEEAAPR